MSGLLNTKRRDQPPRERAPDLNRAFEAIRTGRGLTRKEMARVIELPPRRLEKIERREIGVTLDSLQAIARIPEGKALVAQLFGLDVDNHAELHALLTRAQQLIWGMPR